MIGQAFAAGLFGTFGAIVALMIVAVLLLVFELLTDR